MYFKIFIIIYNFLKNGVDIRMVLLNEKVIHNNDFRFGVEFECIHPIDKLDDIEDWFKSNKWEGKHDGSIGGYNSRTHIGREYVSNIVPYSNEGMSSVRKVLLEAFKMGCRTNHTCGLHIHFSIKFNSVRDKIVVDENGESKVKSSYDDVIFTYGNNVNVTKSDIYNMIYRLYFIGMIGNEFIDEISSISFDNSGSKWNDDDYANVNELKKVMRDVSELIRLEEIDISDLFGEKYNLIRVHDKYCTLEWRGPRGLFDNLEYSNDINIANKRLDKIFLEITNMINKMVEIYNSCGEDIINYITKNFKYILRSLGNKLLSSEDNLAVDNKYANYGCAKMFNGIKYLHSGNKNISLNTAIFKKKVKTNKDIIHSDLYGLEKDGYLVFPEDKKLDINSIDIHNINITDSFMNIQEILLFDINNIIKSTFDGSKLFKLSCNNSSSTILKDNYFTHIDGLFLYGNGLYGGKGLTFEGNNVFNNISNLNIYIEDGSSVGSTSSFINVKNLQMTASNDKYDLGG